MGAPHGHSRHVQVSQEIFTSCQILLTNVIIYVGQEIPSRTKMMEPTHLQQQKITDYGFNSEIKPEATPVTGTVIGFRRLARWFSRGCDRMTRMSTWVQRRVSWSEGAKKRGQKAIAILEQQDQITRISPGCHSVQSQSQPGLFYTVKRTFTGRHECTCPDYRYRKAQCKHILSVSAQVVDENALAVLEAPGDEGTYEGQIKDRMRHTRGGAKAY